MKQFFKTVFASSLGFILGAVLFTFIGVMIIGGVIASLSDEDIVEVKEHSVIYFKPESGMPERGSEDPLEQLDINNFKVKDRQLGLNKTLAAINAAAADKRIDGMYLQLPNGFSNGYATLKEIRNALQAFKDSGKFIVAYSDFYTEANYYLASLADSIYLNSSGEMLFNGFYAEILFMKGALDKLGIEMQVFKYGKFKSAVEPYLNEGMSPENKLQVRRYLESMLHTYLTDVAPDRHIEVSRLKEISDKLLVRKASDAVDLGLVDALGQESDVFSYIRGQLGISEDKEINSISLADYYPARKKHSDYTSGKIAVVYADGVIQDGESGMPTKKIIEALRSIRKDSSIKAVVLRVNSPGGSALESDVLYHELILTKAVKPLYVSMGNVAASGGYYIAAPGNQIFAQKTSITGSIGVFGVIPNMKKLFNEHLGLTFDGEKTGEFSDLGSVSRPMNGEEKEIIQSMINRTYEDFVNIVSTNRNLSFEQVDSIAQGRVWTGEDAIKIGLVDKIGGINDAIDAAASKVGLSKYRVFEYPVQENSLAKLLGAKEGIKENLLKEELGEAYQLLLEYRQIKEMKGIQMRMPFTWTLQ